ncbi:hypothetical protein BpHYR1_038186 [Brachionus plicatilis]|uniref:Uncharacterized protein n=1 Tax=Brachionus plicatilis TaxID=10195 RepID=A0A3M7S5V5_BRAPC|nr:hypothetical protein BpHYR1_038186 [Brachionus plicatilis]
MEKVVIDSNNNSTILKIDLMQTEKIREVKKRIKKDCESNVSVDQGNKFSFRLWNIRMSDLDSEEKYLRQKTFNFKLEAKFFRFSGFNSFGETTLMFSKKRGLEIMTSESTNQITMVISSEDILYCACVFQSPVFMLFIKIGDCVANIFYDKLKSLNSFDKKFKANLINLTRIAVFLKTSDIEVGLISNNLKRFFDSISDLDDKPRRLDFLNLKKSKELLISEFESDQDILKEIYDFISE